MLALKETIFNGRPECKADVNAEISLYFVMRDELAINDGLIFKEERVVVPQGMRKEIKHRLHESHWERQHGTTCMSVHILARNVSRHKTTLAWLNLEATRPWEKVGTDLFTWNNKDYLLTSDYFSGWREVDQLLQHNDYCHDSCSETTLCSLGFSVYHSQ